MNAWLIRLGGILGFAVLVLITIRFCAPHIESSLQSDAVTALQQQGLDWADVHMKGRELTLSGHAPTTAMRLRAERVVRDLPGPVKVTNTLVVNDPVDPYTLTVDYDGSRLFLTGYTADQQSQQAITQAAHESFGSAKVVSNWQLSEGQPDAWTAVASGIINGIKTLSNGKVTIENKTISIAGQAHSISAAQQFEERLSAYRNSGYDIRYSVAAPPPPPTCQEQFDGILAREQIQFGNNIATIDAASFSLLKRLQAVAEKCQDAGIIIAGHTDAVGDGASNQKLSEQRAQSVLAHLVKEGINPSRLSAVGYGESKPIADNGTADGRAKNRRIKFTIKGYSS